MTERKLVLGRFYWVLPVFDVNVDVGNFPDYDSAFEAMQAHWTNREQPARFVGYRDDGEEQFMFIGEDGVSDWPVRWVGMEIMP